MIIIDRFEEEYAVCEKEDMEMVNIPIMYLPKGVKEIEKLTDNMWI